MHIKKRLLAYLTRNLLRGITEDDLLLIMERGWVSKGRKCTPEERAEIKAQASDFAQSILWEYIEKELEYAAFVRGRKALTDKETYMSHALYYNLDLIRKFLDRCKAL